MALYRIELLETFLELALRIGRELFGVLIDRVVSEMYEQV